MRMFPHAWLEKHIARPSATDRDGLMANRLRSHNPSGWEPGWERMTWKHW